MTSKELRYQPSRLLDMLIKQLNVETDAGLARTLCVKESLLRNIRRRSLPVSGFLLLHMSEVTGIEIKELRHLMGDRRRRLRIGYKLKRRA